MEEVHRIRDLEISVVRDEISGLLGYGESDIPNRVRTMITEAEAVAPRLLSPACAYRIMANEEYPQSRYLNHVEQSAFCLVTIGAALESEVQRHKENGELARALVLDVYGSAAAEATAAAANGVIESAVSARGLRCSRRFSPGYGAWDVAEQRWILPALEADALEVTLTEGCMMNPRKSITFAVTIGDNPVEMRTADICETCGAVNCRLRHTPRKCFGKRSDR
jgi:hypothetical protein